MSADSPEQYLLGAHDRSLLAAASAMLAKLAASGVLRPAEVASLAKLQHVLSRLPRVTSGLEVRVDVKGPWRRSGDIKAWHWWAVSVDGGELAIEGGGWLQRPSTGGESFTTMTWEALPGETAELDDYRDHLAIVPGVQSFPIAVDTIDFTTGDYIASVDDPDNPLLQESDDVEEGTVTSEAGTPAPDGNGNWASQPALAAIAPEGREHRPGPGEPVTCRQPSQQLILSAEQHLREGWLVEAVRTCNELLSRQDLTPAQVQHVEDMFVRARRPLLDSHLVEQADAVGTARISVVYPSLPEISAMLTVDGSPILVVLPEDWGPSRYVDGIFEAGRATFVVAPSMTLLDARSIRGTDLQFDVVDSTAGPFFHWRLSIDDGRGDSCRLDVCYELYGHLQAMDQIASAGTVEFVVMQEENHVPGTMFPSEHVRRYMVRLPPMDCRNLRELLVTACRTVASRLESYSRSVVNEEIQRYYRTHPLRPGGP